MSSDSAGDDRRLPNTQDNAGLLLKTVRYEDADAGVPPVPVASINPPPWSASSASVAALRQGSQKRSTALTGPRASALSDDVKRDSGIAPSVSTAGRASYSESQQSSAPTASGAAWNPGLPTIVVQNAESPEPVERSTSSFSRKKSKEASKEHALPINAHQRIESFHGISSEIPTGSFGDLDFGDLASDKLGFSQRGSLLFGGKKMNELISAQGDGTASNSGIVQPIRPAAEEQTKETASPSTIAGAVEPKQGLVSGRRKPSVHMLQAALQGGRVLSAEDITFSMKVRSMYEHGDENAAEWGTARSENSTPDGRDSSTPAASIGSLNMSKTRECATNESSLRPQSAQNVRASYARHPTEIAGGVEDWNDVHGEDVDRYGFINPMRNSSRPSTASHSGREGIQRVATALRLEAEQPRRHRKLQRGVSNARSARSVPSRPSKDDMRSAGSMHSFKSGRSAQGPSTSFFSKDRKTLAEAAHMLTLPPGLAEIAEQEDGGKPVSSLKRREWARDEKWQKMARPVRERSNSKGGGMRFEFDTSDPKLVGRTWKGIPDRWRAMAWHSFLSTSAKRRGGHVPDDELINEYHKLQEENCADDVQIDVDVPRTINLHIMFRRRYRGGQRLLFRVLHAISLYCPEPGYVQGMASLAATLLCYYDEEQAFVMLVRLWQLRGLEQLFQSEFVGLIAALDEFEREWLGSGDVAQKLEELGIPSTSYGTRWYLTLFNMSVPFPAQLRIWDVFMLLGDAASGVATPFGGADLDVLHATSAALIDATREIILDADFEVAMKVLTSFIPIKDEDLLMRVARTEYKMRKKRIGGRA
ncbi:hypothetical protein LTR10_013886 [Elasticomyces elasticus]|nr:hypothetical protein LTR10_013886 [Elasticomyces elasticus]KAK4974530.1 hypothetical protein LTR42_005175 [Elasticomyces elasticus]